MFVIEAAGAQKIRELLIDFYDTKFERDCEQRVTSVFFVLRVTDAGEAMNLLSASLSYQLLHLFCKHL